MSPQAAWPFEPAATASPGGPASHGPPAARRVRQRLGLGRAASWRVAVCGEVTHFLLRTARCVVILGMMNLLPALRNSLAGSMPRLMVAGCERAKPRPRFAAMRIL